MLILLVIKVKVKNVHYTIEIMLIVPSLAQTVQLRAACLRHFSPNTPIVDSKTSLGLFTFC